MRGEGHDPEVCGSAASVLYPHFNTHLQPEHHRCRPSTLPIGCSQLMQLEEVVVPSPGLEMEATPPTA